jgi:hypothetical protein
LEPLQEQVEKVIAELELEKRILEQVYSESIEVLKGNITMQVVETPTEKSMQAKNQVDELAKKFKELEKFVQEAHTT